MNSTSTILWSFGIWSKLERWKISTSECLTSWSKKEKKKKAVLMCLLFSYLTTMNHLLIVLWKVDSWQLVMTCLVAGLRRSTKALPRAKLVKRKGSWSNLVGCCWPYPLYLSESQRNHYISAVYSAKWMPKCMSHNQCFKSWTKWATKFYLICHIHLTSHQMTATS